MKELQTPDLWNSIKDTLSTLVNNTSQKEVMTIPLDELNLGISIFAIVLSILGIYYSWLAYRFSKKTADNVVRTSSVIQLSQFNDQIRHLYRNLVCTFSMFKKYELDSDSYPSESHLLKLKVLPEDIMDIEKYNDQQGAHKFMHELKLLLRNYNTEIDVTLMHVSSRFVPEVTAADFNGLIFKPLYLMAKVASTKRSISIQKGKDHEDQAYTLFSIIIKEHINKLRENISSYNEWKDNLIYGEFVLNNRSYDRSYSNLINILESNEILIPKYIDKDKCYSKDSRNILDELLKAPEMEQLLSGDHKRFLEADRWAPSEILAKSLQIDLAIEMNKIVMIKR